jgi:hypothetical protein
MKPSFTASSWFDEDEVRECALEAMKRARVAVHPVPVAGANGCYTLSTESAPLPDGALSRADAERYAAAINGEAQLARAVMVVLNELETLKKELEKARALPLPHSDIGGGGG